MSFAGLSVNTNTQTPQTGGGLFGNNQQQQGGGLFGAPNQQATQSTQPPSLFGNPSTTTNTGGGGLFGAQSNAPNTNQGGLGGGLFGGGASGQQNQPQQQPAGGGLFGTNTQQTAPTGGGLFGGGASNQQQPAAGSGLFGSNTQQTAPSTGGGLFGGASNQQQQQQPAAGGGLFGSNTQQPGTTGGLFGGNTQQNQQQQPQQPGGLFGSTTQPQPAATGGGLFGGGTQTGGGGLFGGSKPGGIFGSSLNTNTTGTNQPTTTTNPLFGGALGQQPQQQQQAGSLFAQPAQNQQQQQQQQQQRPSLFGSLGQSTTGANPLFASSTNNNPLFGGGNNSTLNASALGTSALGGGGPLSTTGVTCSILTRGPVGPVQQQGDAQAQQARLVQRMEAVYNAWDPNSPQCRFQHTFYNLVNPNQVSLYRQPPNISNQTWEKAARDNPDPTRFVPVVAIGFDDLRERVEAQSRQAEEHKTRLLDLKASLNALAERHAVSNASRLQRAATQQTQLTQRLLAFIQHLHLLIPTIRSSSIRPEEEQLRGKLEEIEEDVRRGRMKGKLNELWALIGAVNAAKERGRVGGEWAVVDDEGLSQIAQILSEQQAGLAHLTKILQTNLKDLNVIMKGDSGGEDSYANDGDPMWSSTSTLRASSLR